jgi:microcystin-dependent protein
MESYLASIIMFAGNFAPRGWLFCDGSILSIAQNTALFSLLGTTYGGDGKTTFALPNLKTQVPATDWGVHYIICVEGIYPSRS